MTAYPPNTGTCWTVATPADVARMLESGDGPFPAAGLERLEHMLADGGKRSRLDFRGDYLVGVFVVPVMDWDQCQTWEQQVYVLSTHEQALTVLQHPPGRDPFDLAAAEQEAEDSPLEGAGDFLSRVVGAITDELIGLVDTFQDQVGDAEAAIMDSDSHLGWSNDFVQHQLRLYRSSLLAVRGAVNPLLDKIDGIVARRLDLRGQELFPPELEARLADVHDGLLYVTESLDFLREEVAGLRDFHQAQVANEQNDVMKTLTVGASLLLVPTFIVGLFGQNFSRLPWQDWHDGFWWSVGLIAVITLLQLAIYTRVGWIGHRGEDTRSRSRHLRSRSQSASTIAP